jgi:hypothetical protein
LKFDIKRSGEKPWNIAFILKNSWPENKSEKFLSKFPIIFSILSSYGGILSAPGPPLLIMNIGAPPGIPIDAPNCIF